MQSIVNSKQKHGSSGRFVRQLAQYMWICWVQHENAACPYTQSSVVCLLVMTMSMQKWRNRVRSNLECGLLRPRNHELDVDRDLPTRRQDLQNILPLLFFTGRMPFLLSNQQRQSTRTHTHTRAHTHTHTHTHTHPFYGPFPGLPGWAATRKVKPIWILLKQETVSGSGISWAVCKSAPRSRQITMPAPHHSVFTGRMPYLPPTDSVKALKAQSTEGTAQSTESHMINRKIFSKSGHRLLNY